MRYPERILSAAPHTIGWFGAWLAILAACVWAYWPGLGGPFLLDDNKTLAELGTFAGVTDWASFKAFVLGGHAGPTGRPLALLTFVADGTHWPTDPWPFKRTNLIVHCLSGVVLGLLMQRVLTMLQYDRSTVRIVALVAAAIWLLHPFLVSTTLYVVQRMAQMSTLFILLALLVYLHGREKLAYEPGKAYLWMSAGIVFGTALATLSKENGILLPLLVGITELTIVASQRPRVAALHRIWATIFLLLPSLTVFAYLGWQVSQTGMFDLAPEREFSIYERLLTQFRILADYLQHWFVPELYTTGVFQDHFVKSTGLLTPVTTLLGLLLHSALLLAAWLLRRRMPLFAFAVLFFYGSHSLESSVLNLELYFEHRNYLAAAFLALPVIVFAKKELSLRTFVAVSLVLVSLLAGFTRYSATVWADNRTIVEASAEKAPTSVRAQQQLAILLFNDGEYDASIRVIDRALTVRPESDALLITRGIILCRVGALRDADFADIASHVSSQAYNSRLFRAYADFVAAVTDGGCIDAGASKVRSMFEGMLMHPDNSDPGSLAYSHIQYFIGNTWVRDGDISSAVAAFDRSLDARGGPGAAMMMAAILASSAYYDEALRYSARALEKIDDGDGAFAGELRVRRADVLEFRQKVKEELEGPEYSNKN